MTPARRLQVLLAAIPPIMLSLAIPLVNRDEPRIFGFPFLLVWMILWVALTPLFLFVADRLGRTS